MSRRCLMTELIMNLLISSDSQFSFPSHTCACVNAHICACMHTYLQAAGFYLLPSGFSVQMMTKIGSCGRSGCFVGLLH